MTHKPMNLAAWERFKEDAKESSRLATFEGSIERLEAICQRVPGTRPNRPPDVRPEEHSQAWYAEEILSAISFVRLNLEQGHASHAAGQAVIVGVLAALAGTTGTKWREIQRWLKGIEPESKEDWLTGEVISRTALAGQICKRYDGKNFGLDMEIEFRDDDGKPTAEKVYLQLKSGDSHLKRRKRDGAEVFRIRKQDHANYWMREAYPVFLVIANSRGEVRWMEIRDYLKRESDNGKSPLCQLVFSGEAFDVESICSWRNRLLGQRNPSKNKRSLSNPAPALGVAVRRCRTPHGAR
jgi:hypothetical protein